MPSMQINLNEIRLYARHGVFPQENRVGAEYLLNISVGLEMSPGCYTDDLAGTISYADIYAVVKETFLKPCRLIEHAATNVAKKLAMEFSSINALDIEVVKVTPPIPGYTGSAAVRIFFEKKELENLVNPK